MNHMLYLFAQYQIKVDPLPHVTTGPDKVKAILTIVFGVVGAIALLMFTIGGMRYITAQGDPQSLTKAKDTLIYSLVGLLVSISAVAIVTFVLGNF